MAPAAAQAAAGLLPQYATEAAAVEGLAQLGCQPLLALLRAVREAEGMAAFQPPEKAADGTESMGSDAAQTYAPSSSGGSAAQTASSAIGGSKAYTEQEALEALRAKLRKVFIADLVALQRCLLTAACQLAGASRELLLSEAVVEQGSSSAGGSGKRGLGAGPFLTELLELARELHGQQPRRTAPVLGPDGNPKAYAKRRFAADFKDNPAGDFLLSMDLQQGSSSSGTPFPDDTLDSHSSSGSGGANPAAQASQPRQPTMLELSLSLLLATARASPTAAALLHRRDVLGLCEELSSYCTPAVVGAAQQLVAAVADRVPAAAEEIVQGGNVPALAALLLHSTSSAHQQQAADKLAALADTCTGDDFAALTATAPGATAGIAQEAAAAQAQAEAAAAQAAMAVEQEAALAYRQQQQEAAAAEADYDEEDEIADLQDVYDSSSSLAAQQRRVRAEWLALPMDKKLRWTQTSLDVSVHVQLPPGTRASDVQVTTTVDRLTISLKWYGRVLDGQLHLRVKPSETHWCLEDSEVHVLLAKAEADAWWKKLVEGGQERGYYELLKEAVDADEPEKPFEQLGDDSLRLLDAIQERQAYIQAGLIDPEGFDDFRVVIGEHGLRPSQAES
ncbi:BOBBER 2-like [Chlorella sorokiniana]|uniref:BOBBER 2-like n=1 Tax=Chlorella sorokiniana TaxID=3076 RepID=A0A2P6TJ78_CHLSO|nr:BOBBER 2-like [Chlorella sorokiniana]|eukprot:PRW39305.1 BOBBER 2-like [Chlorella sorokiniana]